MKRLLTAIAVIALIAFAAPAFATANPFMDVPAGHWAYDAVAQLASRGIASGYPDGAYKGAQPATRYEMASMVARVLSKVDMEKASKQDVELLKRLVLEFKNELDALGVKVGELDKRVAVLEDGIGGWKIRGIFRFDAKFGGSDNGGYLYSNGKENQFTKERFRLFLTKAIDENTYFYAQYRTGGGDAEGMGDVDNGFWSHLYADTKLPWDTGLRVGRFAVDFEDDYGLYTDNDALFGAFRIDGFQLKKSFGQLNATAVVGRNASYLDKAIPVEKNASGDVTYKGDGDFMAYILDLNFQPNEKFMMGATGYWGIEDAYNGSVPNADFDINTYAFYAGYNFTPSIALKGIYYAQSLGDDVPGASFENSPQAWKAILDVKQEALKFTSLWIEYSREDNSFRGNSNRYAIGGGAYDYVGFNSPINAEKSDYIFVLAQQQWTNKFSTFARYARADFNTSGLDDATEWGLGIGYQYTPAIYFELAYNQVDHGSNNNTLHPTAMNDKESVVRFRTTVNF